MEAEAVAAMTCPGAIPLKTAVRTIRGCRSALGAEGVTIKREAHIKTAPLGGGWSAMHSVIWV